MVQLTEEREIEVDVTEDEWLAMMNAPEADRLSAAARAALMSATPAIPGFSRWFSCTLSVARELLQWCEGAIERIPPDSERIFVLRRVARQLRFALSKVGEGPPPGPLYYRQP